jgi:hypothetical protein
MEMQLLDHPWRFLWLAYLGVWFVIFVCAGPHDSPPAPDGSPSGPPAPGEAPAEAAK